MRTRSWVVLVLVVAVLLVADVAAASLTNRRAADAFVASQRLPDAPYVHVDGFPFFVKRISGHYGHVTVRANDAVSKEQDPLDLHFLKLEMYGVRADGGWTNATAGSVDGTARIGYRSISKRLGARVRFAGPGQLVATMKVEVRGRTYQPRVLAHPELRDGDIVFGDIAEEIPTAVPAEQRAQLEQVFRGTVDLGSLPFGVSAHKVGVDAEAVVIRVSGRDLDLDAR